MNYVRHNNALNTLYKNLDDLAQKYQNSQKNFVMFGANKIAGMIVFYLAQKNIHINLIVDNAKSKQGMSAWGYEIDSPNNLIKRFGKNVVVLIASGFQDAMIKQLEEMGYVYGEHIIKAIDLPLVMNDYSYVDRSNYSPMSQTDIKKSQIATLEFLHKTCQKHGLRYFMAYGTLLGAVRHKGFIPWDDDIDVWMPAVDLYKLTQILKNNNDYNIISVFNPEDDYGDDCHLLFDMNTIVDSNHFPMQLTMGISIDIYTLSGVYTDTSKQLYSSRKVQQLMQDCRNHLFDRSNFKERKKIYSDFILNIGYDGYDMVGNELSPDKTYPYDWFGEGCLLEFENHQFIAPANYHSVLSTYFGDYMTPPPESQRTQRHYLKAYYKQQY